MMSQFAVLTRLKEPENSSLYRKMLVYDGENLKDTDPRAKSYQEYRDYAGVDEGMSGISHALRLQDHLARSSTSTAPRSPPTRCT